MKKEILEPGRARATVIADDPPAVVGYEKGGYSYTGPNRSLSEESFEKALAHVHRDNTADDSIELSGHGRVRVRFSDPYAKPALIAHFSRIPSHAIRDTSDRVARALGLVVAGLV